MLNTSSRQKLGFISGLLSVLALVMLVSAGCGPSQTVKPDKKEAAEVSPGKGEAKEAAKAAEKAEKRITEIRINKTGQALVVVIKANHALDYTLAEPPFQQAKVLYFPDAGLDLVNKEFSTDSDVVGTVKAKELVAGGPSKIIIPVLKAGAAYEIIRRTDQESNVNFPVSGMAAEKQIETETAQAETPAAEAAQPQPKKGPEESAPLATTLKKINVRTAEDGVGVKVAADGSIKSFKSFTLKSPPRIVVDLAGVESSYIKEQRLPVDSDLVTRVRHFSHPDYLRVVLDVNKDYLGDYETKSVSDGFLVTVGDFQPKEKASPAPEAESMTVARAEQPAPESGAKAAAEKKEAVAPGAEKGEAKKAAAEATAAKEKAAAPRAEKDEAGPAAVAEKTEKATEKPSTEPAEKHYAKAALVNNIDFIEEKKGRSTIKIGTTHPVNYELKEVGDKLLRLQLKGANILSFRQRPLITTRFDSAVDCILPVQTQKMKKAENSYVNIRLREQVPYELEQKDNALLVHFAPSSKAPKPPESVVIPTEEVIADAQAEAAEEEAAVAEAEQAAPEKAPSAEAKAAAVKKAAEKADKAAQVEKTAAASAKEEAEAEETLPEEPKAEIETEAASILGKKKEKEYTGQPIALDFYKTDLRNVIRILKDVSGKNFAIDKDVSGSVTLSFINPVPWDQVLDLILQMNDLGMVKQDGIIRIATQETIRRQKEAVQAELKAEQELQKTEEQLAPLETEYLAVSYSDAEEDILPQIESVLSERGHAKVDSRTNQVVMTDVPEKIEKAKEIIEKIDQVTPQVMIKARIVETSTDFSREFGTEWSISEGASDSHRAPYGDYTYDVALNNPAGNATNRLGINFSRIAGTPFSLDAKLSLMESTNKLNIVSSPRVVTLDNKMALISQGQEVPYTDVSEEGVAGL